jgi:hypothetical protein
MHTLKAGKEFRKAPSCSNFIKQLRSKPYQTNLVEALGQPTQPRQPDSCILADWVFKRCQQTEVELYPCILLLAALLLGGGNGLASPVSPSSSIPISRLSGPSRGVNKQRWGCIHVPSCPKATRYLHGLADRFVGGQVQPVQNVIRQQALA